MAKKRYLQKRIPQAEPYWQSGGKRWHPPVPVPATGLAEVFRLNFSAVVTDVDDSRRGSTVPATDVPMPALITCYPLDVALPGEPLRYVVTAGLSS